MMHQKLYGGSEMVLVNKTHCKGPNIAAICQSNMSVMRGGSGGRKYKEIGVALRNRVQQVQSVRVESGIKSAGQAVVGR